MIRQNDCLLLLTDLQEHGVDVKEQITKLLLSKDINLEVLKFINDNRQLDVSGFYTLIRKNYNNKKSNLYKNIMKEIVEPQEVLTTLSALLTQILLYSKHLDVNKQLFLSHSRAEEIIKVLEEYFKSFDITKSIQLLRLIKADIVALEFISGHRSNTLK